MFHVFLIIEETIIGGQNDKQVKQFVDLMVRLKMVNLTEKYFVRMIFVITNS